MQTADIGTSAKTDTGADRRQYDVAGFLVIHADASDKIKRAFNTEKPLENLLVVGQLVDQYKNLRNVAADVETNRRSLPMDRTCRTAFAVESTLAETQTNTERPTKFL